MINQISVSDLKDRQDSQKNDFVLLDVREAWEINICALANSLNIPMGQVPARLDDIDKQLDVVIICHHGIRSQQVAYFLQNSGYKSLYNLAGGISAWSHDIDSSVPTY